jgi:hypothetical protein
MPVSAHPAFPAIVALWFAALLGLGTIVMPAVVLEQIATATGLASVFPPAEPPLDWAGRGLFALLSAMLGLIGGLVLARRVAQVQDAGRPASRRRTPAGRSAPPRPLSVHEDLGEDAIAPPADAPRAGRRRALTMTEETPVSDFLSAAPLPGESDVSELPEDPMSERPSDFDPPHADELDLSELPEAPTDAQVFEPMSDATDASAEPPVVPAYVPELDTRKPRPITAPESAAKAADSPIDPFSAPIAAAPIDGPLDNLGMVQLAERLGRSLQQRLDVREAELEAQAEAEPEGEPLAFAAPSFDHPEDAIAVPPPVVPDALRAFMDTAPKAVAQPPAAEAQTEAVMPPPVVPSALIPFAFQSFEDEDDDEAYNSLFTLPRQPTPPVMPEPPVADTGTTEELAEDEDDALADENYSSLLEMSGPFRARDEAAETDRDETELEAEDSIEDAVAPTPARPFDAPHQAAPSPTTMRPRPAADAAETERALRSALANLQRMSGAA